MSEQHKFQFRGCWIPPEVFDLLTAGDINGTDLTVLMLVEALVDPRGKGCWASNAYIGKSVSLYPDNVSRSLTKLTKLGLLKTYYKQGVRYLETSWSRTAKGVGESPRGVVDNNKGVVDNNKGGVVDIDRHNKKSIQLEEDGHSDECPVPPKRRCASEETPQGGRQCAEPREHPTPRANKKTEDLEAPSPTEDKDSVCAAKKLHDALRANNRQTSPKTKAPSSTKNWATAARLLRDTDGQDYEKVLDWFCDHCSLKDQSKYRLPAIINFAQFRKHYEWIQNARQRARRDRRNSGEPTMAEIMECCWKEPTMIPLPNGSFRFQSNNKYDEDE